MDFLFENPDAVISDDDTAVAWEETELCRQIRTNKTPGRILQAYRERAGFSIMQLSEKTGIKYTNISTMEHDGRVIGLSSARRIAKALGFDYTKLLV
jgi:ribosome-binding protein aMBF1 (putative translation factor)